MIDEYISYFKDSKGPGKKQEYVKKSLLRHRSNSEDAFFKVKREKSATHRGLVGAEGTAPQNQVSKSPVREVLMQKEGCTRKIADPFMHRSNST